MGLPTYIVNMGDLSPSVSSRGLSEAKMKRLEDVARIHNSSQFHRCFTSIPFQLLSQSQALPLRQVHKHSGMGCAVVSLSTAETREAIMCYAEKTFGRSAAGKLEMDIADVKVQLSLGTVGKGTLW